MNAPQPRPTQTHNTRQSPHIIWYKSRCRVPLLRVIAELVAAQVILIRLRVRRNIFHLRIRCSRAVSLTSAPIHHRAPSARPAAETHCPSEVCVGARTKQRPARSLGQLRRRRGISHHLSDDKAFPSRSVVSISTSTVVFRSYVPFANDAARLDLTTSCAQS